ncbi:MAG: plasmid pRiA4b ORF-3 family protein [Bacteroidales bacterium]|nr:plasmid pRiA4b ORF-3 family protein [Bacteroidales bacterium]
MIYRFILVSDEVEDFRRDIKIDSEATFFELHESILDSVGYTKDQITSFFICDDDWVKKTEITLIDMESSSEEDIFVMDSARLSELIDEEKQKLIYVFEPLTERCFFMELKEIITGQDLNKAEVVKSVGNPPLQISLTEELDLTVPIPSTTEMMDDDFMNEDFNLDEYDEEAFGDLNEGNPFDNY